MVNGGILLRAAPAIRALFAARDRRAVSVSVDDMEPFVGGVLEAMGNHGGNVNYQTSWWDGDKFSGGFGATNWYWVNYWALRLRSRQLFVENLYARGLIRRLVTNEINTGLTPGVRPEESIIGVEPYSLEAWAEDVEARFGIWSDLAKTCDWKHKSTFGELQEEAYREALVCGDVLVVLRYNQTTRLPQVQLISGNRIQTPLGGQASRLRRGHTIRHGVEFDAQMREVGYWVQQQDGYGVASARLAAYGEKSGRRIAWLVTANDKLLDEARGQPLLSLILQSLKEVDRYRDSIQRKAVINSLVAMFIQRNQTKQRGTGMAGGAVRLGAAQAARENPDAESAFRHIPGVVLDRLQVGEEPKAFRTTGTDEAFGDFESAVLSGIAWSNEVPVEILTLKFANNYSASQAALNEFKHYLQKRWARWGKDFCEPIYREWLLAESLNGKITAPGMLEAWRDPTRYDIAGAWLAADWYGTVKPSADPVKTARGAKMQVDAGWTTNTKQARMLDGSKFSRNARRIRRENELLAEALEPLIAARAAMRGTAAGAGDTIPTASTAALGDQITAAVEDALDSRLEEFISAGGLTA